MIDYDNVWYIYIYTYIHTCIHTYIYIYIYHGVDDNNNVYNCIYAFVNTVHISTQIYYMNYSCYSQLWGLYEHADFTHQNTWLAAKILCDWRCIAGKNQLSGFPIPMFDDRWFNHLKEHWELITMVIHNHQGEERDRPKQSVMICGSVWKWGIPPLETLWSVTKASLAGARHENTRYTRKLIGIKGHYVQDCPRQGFPCLGLAWTGHIEGGSTSHTKRTRIHHAREQEETPTQ